MNPIRIGILGYGNLGRGIELAVAANDDMELVGVFTRRDPATVHPLGENVAVWPATELAAHTDDIDVLMLAGGSATDLPEQTPAAAALYNVVDSFDTHANIPAHFAAVDAVARETGHVAVISVGWDPGMFSVSRVYANAIMPNGADYTFWGRGVSQGHSDAIRRIPGVVDARQYTVPVPEALEAVRSGANPELTTRQKHTRECFVVAEEGADTAAIEEAIVTMPNYFADYDTTVTFISQEELDRDHAGIPHGGSVIRTGTTGAAGENTHVIEYSLKLDSNPEFTGSVLVACARACWRMACAGETGCRTIFDIAPALLSPMTPEELRAKMLYEVLPANLPLNVGTYFRVVRLPHPAKQKKRTRHESFSCFSASFQPVFQPQLTKPLPAMSNKSKFCDQNGNEIAPGKKGAAETTPRTSRSAPGVGGPARREKDRPAPCRRHARNRAQQRRPPPDSRGPGPPLPK